MDLDLPLGDYPPVSFDCIQLAATAVFSSTHGVVQTYFVGAHLLYDLLRGEPCPPRKSCAACYNSAIWYGGTPI